jgi:CheY-like chemotaxis protein
MRGILQSWGCRVVTAASEAAALKGLVEMRGRPDLIISDFRLAGAKTGIGVIKQLRGELGAAIPAFLISGDTAPELLREASEGGFQLLHKPVPPMRLRAMLNQLLKARDAADAAPTRPTRARAARHRAPRPQ